ncbi:MAG: hypothetical protein RIS70_1513 [Planctomycetota bacterium]
MNMELTRFANLHRTVSGAFRCRVVQGGWVLAATVLVALTGCTQVRLPAIDPSGSRLFLPSPASTTLESCLPKPAFKVPPNPPACPDRPCSKALGLDSTLPESMDVARLSYEERSLVEERLLDGQRLLDEERALANPLEPPAIRLVGGTGSIPAGRNQLRLNPARLVATVNSEVVLVTGFCGPDGYFLMKQPIEWILTQDSVGHFVEVGRPSNEYLAAFFHETPKKLGPNYALGMTATSEYRITRGNCTPYDDVRVGRGQTWISLTSPTEGTSHVSVIAPKAENWDQRRQTATIHWVDVQWAFPPPGVGRAGEPIQLTTTLTRATNGSPLKDWVIRYELPEGMPASLESDAAADRTDRAVDVVTDANGHASVYVRPNNDNPGSYPVVIQVIRPALASGDLPRTILGQGASTVTWSAPGLAVKITGSQSNPVGSTFPVRLDVSNYGDMPARGVVVSANVPPNWKYVGSNVAAREFPDRVEWDLGDLPGQSTRSMEATFEALRGGDVKFCARAQSADGLLAEDCLDRMRVFEPTISISMRGPDTGEVGSEVQFQVELTNRGDTPLNNVRLVDRFDPGLSHVSQAGQMIDRVIPLMQPGETIPVNLTFRIREPGTHCHTLQVTADGAGSSSARGCVKAVMPAGGLPASAKLRARITGGNQARVGEKVRYQIDVENVSNQALNNVRVAVEFDSSLDPKNATGGFDPKSRSPLVWDFRTLFPSEKKVLLIDYLCLNASTSAVCRVRATANPNLIVEDQTSLEIIDDRSAGGGAAGPAMPDAGAGAAAPQERGGQDELALSLGTLDNPATVGKATDLVILISNNQPVEDRNLVLSMRIPDGVEIGDITGAPPGDWPPVSDPKLLVFPILPQLGPQPASKRIVVQVKAKAAGAYNFDVQVKSLRSPLGVAGQARLNVVE